MDSSKSDVDSWIRVAVRDLVNTAPHLLVK
jgi:hypothetical protein